MSYGFDSSSTGSTFGDDSSFDSATKSTGNTEMQMALQQLQTQAEFQTQVSALTQRCWDLCYTGAPGTKLDEKRGNCMKNCVERYIDVSVFMRNRFQQIVARAAQQ